MNESSPHLLDTTAILTLLTDEPGADRVEDLLRNGDVAVPFVARVEAYYVSLRQAGEAEAERRLFLLRQLPVRWLDTVTEAVLVTAGRFKARHGLSLADSLVAAFAAEAGAVLVHKNPEYEALADLPQERLPSR